MKENLNRYALVHPTNALRLTLRLLAEHKIKTDIKIKATAHAKSILTHKEPRPEIDADYIITSQPTLIFHGRKWLKPHTVIDQLNRLQIQEVPLQRLELILPSTYDGKNHWVCFALVNTHTPLFKKMVAKGEIPYRRLLKIHKRFIEKLKEKVPRAIYRHLKASIMVMVDVNPGKHEMYNRDFVLGLRQPFMQKVVTTKALWECIDYEVI